jgi:thiosulfate dehydrogenase
MMGRRWAIVIAMSTFALYVCTIVIGMHIKNYSFLQWETPKKNWRAWRPPHLNAVPETPRGASIRYGALLFDETPLYASTHTGGTLSCSSCHAEGGIQPYAAPMVGLPADFPAYNKRAGHVISLRDRIQECFVRSENGTPLAYRGPEMQAIVDYIDWLSEPQPNRKRFIGRGFIDLPDLKPDPMHGAEIYAIQCAGCHGQNGEGSAPLFPPLWGPQAYNDGAGMNNVQKMAAFVQYNMPQNRKGILSPQDAYDVSAFVHSKPRPAFNNAYKSY